MANIKQARPNFLQTSKTTGQKYVKITDPEGKTQRVIIDPTMVEQWDNILDVEFGMEHYDSSTTPADRLRGDGERTGVAFDRWEVVNFTSGTRQQMLQQHANTMKKLLAEGGVKVADPDKIAV